MRFLALSAALCLALPGVAVAADSPKDRCADLYTLSDTLRYPDDYDGIIAGAPAVDYGHGLLAWALETSRHQKRGPLTPESVVLLDASFDAVKDLHELKDVMASEEFVL